MTLGPGNHLLWPTPIGLHRYSEAATVNPLLVAAFAEGRAAQERKRGVEPGPFFASDDDLLDRVKIPEWQDFVKFLVDSLVETATAANREAWGGQSMDLKVGIEGMWFQCSSQGAFHDVHTHGNCSWSSAYIVQVDEPEDRVAHPVNGHANGVTRLYGPNFNALGGAFVDVGNAYLQPPHVDIEPVAGQLLLFPSWLAHQAMPYDGDKERIIISFNASLHSSQGDKLHGYSPH
jgi:Putative 2OG-Fe(II) oxygenase